MRCSAFERTTNSKSCLGVPSAASACARTPDPPVVRCRRSIPGTSRCRERQNLVRAHPTDSGTESAKNPRTRSLLPCPGLALGTLCAPRSSTSRFFGDSKRDIVRGRQYLVLPVQFSFPQDPPSCQQRQPCPDQQSHCVRHRIPEIATSSGSHKLGQLEADSTKFRPNDTFDSGFKAQRKRRNEG